MSIPDEWANLIYTSADDSVQIAMPNEDELDRGRNNNISTRSWFQYATHTEENTETTYYEHFKIAIRKNDEEAVEKLLENEDCYQKIISDSTLMHPIQLASSNGHLGILLKLLTAGENVNVQNGQDKYSPLHLAAENSFNDCAKLLIEKGADISIKDKLKNTVLHIAASKGNEDLCSYLIQLAKRADLIHMRNKQGNTPLHLAAFEGHNATIEILIEGGAKLMFKNNKYFTPLHLAARKGHNVCCEILKQETIKCGINITQFRDKNKPTPLILAAKYGHIHCCKVVITLTDVNYTDNIGNTALHYAALNRYLYTIQFLLQNGADQLIKNDKGNSSIHIAAAQPHDACLYVLLGSINQSPGFSKTGKSAIHAAVHVGLLDNLKILTDCFHFSNEINHRDGKGNSPVHIAIIRGNTAAFDILCESGADFKIPDSDNKLPLHLAAENDRLQILKHLLKGDLNKTINSQDGRGETPLHLAAKINSTDCCYYLLLKGASLNIKDNIGNTPLISAVIEGHSDIVQLLVKRRAKVYTSMLATCNNMLHIAADKGHKECCNILARVAPRLLTRLNAKKQTPLDVAFLSKHDYIFSLLLKKEEECNKPLLRMEDFRLKIHQMMHTAITEERRDIQLAIIDSCAWFDGFDGTLCRYTNMNAQPHFPCKNFRYILQNNPLLAEKVLDKCTEVSGAGIIFNFRLFEDIYYIKRIQKKVKVTTSHILELPFDANGVLVKEAREFEGYNWAQDHPLCIAIQNPHLNIINHRLTTTYLRHYWNSYIRYIFYSMLLYEVISIGCQLLSLNFCWKWLNMLIRANSTNHNLCSFEETDPVAKWNWLINLAKTNPTNAEIYSSEDYNMPMIPPEGGTTSAILLILILFGHFLFELNFLIKIPKIYLRPSTFLRICRIIGLFIYCIPVRLCNSMDLFFGLKEDWQWQVEILTFLISWFLMIKLLNDLPLMNVFMPITEKFARSFLRVLFYIFMIVLVFSIVFHFLLVEQTGFGSIYTSFVKTSVWMLGDLGYNDTFLNKDLKIPYPIMSSIIFLLFVTSISGFLINLIISQPTDHLDKLKNRACLMKAAGRAILLLKLGSSFRRLRRRCCRSIYFDNLYPALLDESVATQKYEFDNEKSLLHITDKLVEQSEQISDLKLQLEQVHALLSVGIDSSKRTD